MFWQRKSLSACLADGIQGVHAAMKNTLRSLVPLPSDRLAEGVDFLNAGAAESFKLGPAMCTYSCIISCC